MGKYFGTDGFRGEAGITLTADHAYKVGRFLGWYYNALRERNGNNEPARIVIGKDTRRSSYMFEYSLVAGLTASGADAYLLHVTTTPSVAYGKSFPQNKWTKLLYCDCGAPMRCEGIDKKANGILNMRFICSATKRIGRKTEKRYGVPCPNPYASEWKLELMAREVFRTVWKDRRTEVLKTVRAVNTYLGVNKTDTEAEQLMSQREMWNRAYDALALERVEKRLDFAEFVTKSNEIAAHIAEIDKALMELSHTAEPVNRFDVEKIEAVLSERIAYPEGKIDPDALKNYVARIIKSNDRYVWLLSLAERLRPEQTQKIAMMQMVTYNGNAIGNEEKPTSGKTEIPDMEFLRRGQNGFILNATRYRRARLTERLFASETALPNEPIPLLQFEIDYPMAYQYQKEQGSATHPGRWQNLEVEVYLI